MEKDDIPHGEKMITFKVRFWTTGLSNKKMALDKGAVTTVTNRSRGIRDTNENHAFFQATSLAVLLRTNYSIAHFGRF